jgi:hypothetical protein
MHLLKGDTTMPCRSALFAVFLICISNSPASTQDVASSPQCAAIRVPDGTQVNLGLAEGLDTQKSVKDQLVRFVVSEPVVVQKTVVIEEGAPATGRLVRLKRAAGFGRSGLLEIAGCEVVAVDGTRIPLWFRETESLGSRDMTWVEEFFRSPLTLLIYSIPVVVAVAAAEQGYPMSLREGWRVSGYVGIEAAEMDAQRRQQFNSSLNKNSIRFPLWLHQNINVGGVNLPPGSYSAAFVSTGPGRGEFAVYAPRGLLPRMLAITSVDVESHNETNNLRSVEYADSDPQRLRRIRLGKYSLRFDERFVIVHVKVGAR